MWRTRGAQALRVTWKRDKQYVLPMHPETALRHPDLDQRGRSRGCSPWPSDTNRATINARATGSAGIQSHERRDTVGEPRRAGNFTLYTAFSNIESLENPVQKIRFGY